MNKETFILDGGNNGGNGFGNGMGYGFEWIWFILIWAIFGNNGWGGFGGRGGFGLPAELNGDAGRQMLMNAIQGNGTAISQIASTLNCSFQQVQTALCNIQSQSGLSTQQIINAMQSGNTQLLSKISDCCCENRLAICQQTNTLQNSINSVAVGQERGFSSVAYETQKQTCDLQNTIKDSTAQILASQAEAERTRLMEKIDALRERNSTLTTQINLEHQNSYVAGVVGQAVAPVTAAVAALQNDVNGIKCKLPETATVPYSPVVGIPNCVAAQYGIGFGGFGNPNGGFWY